MVLFQSFSLFKNSTALAYWKSFSKNIFSSNIIDLAESVDIKVDLPYIDLEKEETTPEAFAHLVRQYFNLPVGPVKNLVNILEKQGVVVHFFDFNKYLFIHIESFF